MGDKHRFDVFAKFIRSNFPPDKYINIADIAGGKGDLNKRLKIYGYKNIVTFNTRKNRKNKIIYKRKLFDDSIDDSFDLLIGMHPDEATDVIINEAGKRKISFVIVPCCILPTVTNFNGKRNYINWCSHLKKFAEKLNFIVRETSLDIKGKNHVIWGIQKHL